MKKILFSILSLVLFATVLPVVSVKAHFEDVDSVREEVLDLSSEVEGIEIIDSNQVPRGAHELSFNSIEDFEEFLKEIEIHQENIHNGKVKLNNNEVLGRLNIDNLYMPTRSTVRNGVHTLNFISVGFFKIWRPSYMNITVEYEYNHHNGRGATSKQFVSIKKISSYSNDVLRSWTQTGSATNIARNKKSVDIDINGYHTLGLNIKGFPLGANINDSYSQTYTLPGLPAIEYR